MVNRRLRIALDFDSVLADILVIVNEILSEKEGRPVDVKSVQWMFLEHLGLEKKYKYTDIFQEVWNRWERIPPTEPNLEKSVWALRKLGPVDIVTAAGGYDSETNRKKWLVKNGITYDNFVVVPMHAPSATGKLGLNYDVWIDDNPNDIVAAISQNKRMLVYDQPWNRHIQTPTRTAARIKTLKMAIPILRGRGGFRGFPRFG